MFNTHVVLYLSSRIVSAAGTFFAVAVFTRLAGSVEYGHYLLIFAWATIVYGFATQWMIVAYFGVFTAKNMNEYVASLVLLLGLGAAVVAVGFIGMALLGIWEPTFLIAVFFLFCCMTIYYKAFEIARSRLEASAAALSMILRSVLIVTLGSLILWQRGTATGLAFAVSLAHLVAAIPCWRASGRIQLSLSSRDASIHLVKYGWPLMLSMGVLAAGFSVDRLLLAHFIGVAALGAYGAIADMMRQCFSVVGEAITFSMITAAKQQFNEGNTEAASRTLKTAFNACIAAAAFGAAFFIVFGDLAVRVLLAPEFYPHAEDLIPIFAIAFAIMTIGQYYFVQVIYFTQASFLVPMYSATMLVVSSLLSVVLIPIYGPKGAVIGLLIGFLIAYGGALIVSRRYYRMPVDLVSLAEISSLAAMFVVGTWLIGRVLPVTIVVQFFEALVFIALGLFVVHRYGLLHTISSDAGEKDAELVS